jgi:hypothetical protein
MDGPSGEGAVQNKEKEMTKGQTGVTMRHFMDFEIEEAKKIMKGKPEDVAFPYACVIAGVEETNRQRNKYNRERGAAWLAFKANR